jgi:hypothetical protein
MNRTGPRPKPADEMIREAMQQHSFFLSTPFFFNPITNRVERISFVFAFSFVALGV